MVDAPASRATQYLLADFTNKNGIKANIEFLSIDALYNKLNDASLADNYDVFQIEVHWLMEFVEKGCLADLTEQIVSDAKITAGIASEILEHYAQYQGRFYAMPFTHGTQLLFYRKDLFESLRMKRLFMKNTGFT